MVVAASVRPVAPDHLCAAANVEWRRVVAEMQAAGIEVSESRALLAVYCQAWARLALAERHINEHGPVVPAPRTGAPIQNPYVVIAKMAADQVTKLAIELGLTPGRRGARAGGQPGRRGMELEGEAVDLSLIGLELDAAEPAAVDETEPAAADEAEPLAAERPEPAGADETGSAGLDARRALWPVGALTVFAPRLRRRVDLAFVVCRAWRADRRKLAIAHLKEAKRQPAPAFVKAAAAEVAYVATLMFGAGAFDTVASIACGHSRTSECMGKQIAAAVAVALDIPYRKVFEDRFVAGVSHPKAFRDLPPLVCAAEPEGRVLLVDDVATSGWHLKEAIDFMRARGSAASAIAWIGGELQAPGSDDEGSGCA